MKPIKLTKIEGVEILDDNIYSENARELLVEEDELTPLEAAFMRGWDEAG